MRILVSVDMSPLSLRVVSEGAALGRAMDADVTLLHLARTEPSLAAGSVGSPGGHQVAPDDVDDRGARIEQMITRLRGEGVRVEGGVELCEDAPHEHIVRRAAELGASYIVIGSHGHGRVYELLLGSVTQGVVRESRVPVVVVPYRGPLGAEED